MSFKKNVSKLVNVPITRNTSNIKIKPADIKNLCFKQEKTTPRATHNKITRIGYLTLIEIISSKKFKFITDTYFNILFTDFVFSNF